MAVAACSSKPGKTFGVVTDPGLGRLLRQSSKHPGPLESRLEPHTEHRAVIDTGLHARVRLCDARA